MNVYKNLKSFGNLKTANETYTSIIFNSLTQMFEYKTEMTDLCTIIFEMLLLSRGKATIVKWNDKYVPVAVTSAGSYMPDGTHEMYTANFINGDLYGELPGDYPVCYNTGDRQPALNIMRFADMLSEVDLSMVFNLQRSRLSPVPIAKNDAMKKQLENIFESIKNGNYTSISADVEKDIITGKTQAVEIVNLNDPKAIEYMNYLSELHDNLTRRIYTLYGMAIQETSKHAQVNEDESNARDGVSWLLPDNMIRMRKNFLDDFNKYFSVSWSVDYTELFKKEREVYDNRGIDDKQPDTADTDSSDSKSGAADSDDSGRDSSDSD